MTSNATDNTNGPAVDDESDQAGQYAELTIGDEEFVIYDRENHEAWIQSTVAVSIEDYR